ncbi:OmpA family protein [Spirosoma radiotolerans]|uniref:Flagellar motor protein MotB n=1 Tax=Spirosoma radiotolerans TaxID=1379870 RepID=A0A0E4A108_9BACT|nr:OmpA family protein [Spirosoma radiotolerans]AKD58418.1 flagellar motor protein MotB [Spirosoma radiotolerans]
MHSQRNLFFSSLLFISFTGLAQQSGLRPAALSPAESKPTAEVKAEPQRQAVSSVQWASRVVGVSSEKKGENYGEQYKAIQALGRPNKLPDVGESPCAWAPFYADGTADEWIQVGFAKPMRARQIVVAENVNPGSIVKVIAIDEKGAEHVVYEATSIQPRTNPLLHIFPKDSALVCQQVKVVINGAALKGLNQIDGIGLSEEVKPITVNIVVSKDIPKEIKKENLGKTVNSVGQEVAPVISPDGRTLYFTRNFNKANIGASDRQDVWFSTLESGVGGNSSGWSEAVNIGSPINNAGDNAISGMSADGRTAYLINVYRPDGGMIFGISKSTRTKAGWSQPVECRIANNYNLHEKNQLEFCVSPDGRAIILAVQRKDTRGDRDLYISLQKSDNTWSEPVSLGGVINSADFESSPFLAADGRTLYFTSGGHPGLGNGDIFVSRRLDDSWGNWSEPENLGPGINTVEWDGYFTIPASGDYAYLSSRGGSLGEDDIFRLKLYPAIKPDPVAIITGTVLDSKSKKPVASQVVSSVVGDQKGLEKVDYNPESGEFKLILPTQKTYLLTASREGYFPTTETVDLSKDKRFRDIRKSILLVKIEPGQKITMREVLFQQSQFALLPGADTELDRVVEMLGKYPEMELLIEGHTDNQGDWEPNMKLAEDRVRVVKEYLLNKGIAPTRIQTKAWGPSKPIASNETEEKRKLNRRVEFTILKL